MLSILAGGLRIAPPEAPVSGYAFGKGVYFADMASKSLGYTRNSGDTSAFLFLCEVAVGRCFEPVDCTPFTAQPKDYDSVKAVGQQCPDPDGNVVLSNGATVPLGKVVDRSTLKTTNVGAGKSASRPAVQHNEFIVYNVDQVRIRYLVQFKEEAVSKAYEC